MILSVVENHLGLLLRSAFVARPSPCFTAFAACSSTEIVPQEDNRLK
jgi:hypothetical protein